MPEGVGYVGDEDHDRIVQGLMELMLFYQGELEDPYRRMVSWWRLYLADREDRRLPHEKLWRAHTVIPYPYSGMETKVAVLSDILNSADPPIQLEGVGPEDEKRAKVMTRAHQYVLIKNRWLLNEDMHLRENGIQGSAVWKIIQTRRSTRMRYHPTEEDIAAFDMALEAAVAKGAPQPPAYSPEAPDDFLLWREQVNTARIFGTIPDPPVPETKDVVEYEGPGIIRTPIWDMRFDPMTEEWADQPVIFQRIVKPRSWVLERTGPNPLPFDPGQVQLALASVGEGRFTQWQEEVAGMLNLSPSMSDPVYKDAVELFECWSAVPEFPAYCVILNRSAIINKTPDVMPYYHGQRPYVLSRNVPVSGSALGISDFQQAYALYHETNTLHDLALDALTLAVLPVFLKARDMGMPDLQRMLSPGLILDVARADGITALTKPPVHAQEVWQQIANLKGDVDETNATPPQVRGSQAQIGRVSATEQTARLNSALQRSKQNVIRLEEEWTPIPRQSTGLLYQFMPAKTRLRVGGDDPGIDAFIDLTRHDLLLALDMDFRFRGATKMLNKELAAQQLEDVMERAWRMGALLPTEVRSILRYVLETLGHKGVARFITDGGTAELEAKRKAEAIAAAQTAMGGKLVAQQGGGAVPPNGAVQAAGAPGEAAPAQEAPVGG